MELDNTEKIIAEKVLDEIAKNQNLTKQDIEKMVEEEIVRAKYLKEGWQIHYARERIKEYVKKQQLTELQINFGYPGWNFLALGFVGNLITQYIKNPFVYVIGALISASSIYFLILFLTKLFCKLFYKNGIKPNKFLLVKKISFIVVIITDILLIRTFYIITMAAVKN